MKKLLIALAAAATTAIGAFADTWETGTAFSIAGGQALEAPVALAEAEVQELSGATADYWAGLTNTVAVTPFAEGAPARMERFTEAGFNHLNYLDVKTAFNAPLFRYAQAKNAGAVQPYDVDNGTIYFEGNVKFTACDEDPDVSEYENAKLVMYVKDLSELDEGAKAETNLYVVVGDKTYNCGNAVAVDEWTKLTIKMMEINEDGQLGFIIFLNDLTAPLSPTETIVVPTGLNTVAANYASKNCLFPSAITSGANAHQIEGIGFAGQGGLDQIAFSTENLKPDPSIANVAFDPATIDTLFVKEGEKDAVSYTGSPATFEFDPAASYTYWYTAKQGYISKTTPETLDLSKGGEVTIDPAAKLAATLSINGGDAVEYDDLADAIDDIATVDGAATLTLNDDVDASIVIANGNEATITIDLNGKTVTGEADEMGAIVAGSGTVIVTNSVAGGSVNIGDADAAVDTDDGEIYIQDGVFNGAVYADGITGGAFDKESNDPEDNLADMLPEGKAFVAGEGDYEGYWVVVDAPTGPFSGGTGTEADPYLISEVKDLVELQEKAADGDTFTGAFFQQTADITLTAAWDGIADFAGTYDGQNYKIAGVAFSDLYSETATSANKYRGFFSKLSTATIKNLTIETTGFATTPATGEYGCAALVGEATSGACTFINVTTKGTISGGNHNVGGFAVKINEATLTSCTNEVNVTGNYTKGAGFVAFTQKSSGSGLTFTDCVNKGAVACAHKAGTSGDNGFAGFVGWVNSPVEFVNCANVGAITTDDAIVKIGSFCGTVSGVTVTGTGCTVASTEIPTVVYYAQSSKPITGLDYYDVDAAAFVANNALAAGKTYKVLVGGQAPAFEFAAAGTIAFNTNVCAVANFDGITVADGSDLEITPSEEGGIVTFTAAAPAPQGIEPGKTIGLGNPGTMTEEQAQEAAASLPIVLTSEDEAAGLTTDCLCVKAVLIGGAYQAVVDVKPEFAPAVDATAETPIAVTDANFSAVVKAPVVGLYYYFTASATVDGTYEVAGEVVRATSDGVTLTAPKSGDARFYKLNATVRPPVVE